MIQDDIYEIKGWLKDITFSICNQEKRIDEMYDYLLENQENDSIKDRLYKIEKYQKEIINSLEKFEVLINPNETLAIYEKHIKKIQEMMLEFKGCISMARSALPKRKKKDS